MQTQLALELGVDQRVDVRDLIVRGEIERDAPRARRERPAPEWERVLSDGADSAFRRRRGGGSKLLVMLVTQGQFYVLDERSGERHALTAERLDSFCRGAEGDALTPPWSTRPLQDYDARGRAVLLSLLGCGDFREMCKRDMVRVDPRATSFLGARFGSTLRGEWGRVSLVWRMVEPTMGHERSREALSAALLLSRPRMYWDDEAGAECFHERGRVEGLVGSLGRDVTRDLLRGYLAKSAELPAGAASSFIPSVEQVVCALARHGVSADPRRVCEHALSLLDVPFVRQLSRSNSVRLWADAIDLQASVRGSVEDRYPPNPAALVSRLECERVARRHAASDEAVARRAGQLAGGSAERDGFLIRPAASVREIVDEGNAQHSCVATFIDAYARGETDLWLMRDAAHPDAPLVTAEVRGGALRQALQSRNRPVTAEQWRFVEAWCAEQGYRVQQTRRMRPLGA